MLFKNSTEPEEPHASVIPSADLDGIEPDLDERHKARNSRNEPSPVSRPKTILQDATSNRITTDV